ncbi:hypothetical protein GO003_014660 [Methylicorpusculum oleiharenae]|nr:hypothetical protein [Methylicorpusculum oleiharenae]MCD2451634.1 hypothetical protein [Methylicorpusculum oleiharenae]
MRQKIANVVARSLMIRPLPKLCNEAIKAFIHSIADALNISVFTLKG